MAHDPYSKTCTDISTQLKRMLKRTEDVRLQFAPKGTAAAVLNHKNLKHWFRSLGSGDMGINETAFIERIEARGLFEFLAILIFASCPPQAAITFVRVLVVVDDWPVTFSDNETIKTLSALPASTVQLEALFTSEFIAYQFYNCQAIFCPVELRRREEVPIAHPERQRLPYLLEQPLAEGSFGKVYKVCIARGHFFDPSSSLNAKFNTEPLDLARKDYLVSSEFRAEDEREVMEKILSSSSRSCENVLENFGSLNIAGSTYSLFMPLAICDLRAYMMDLHKTHPSTLEAKARFMQSAVGLAEGLSFLHNDIKTDLEDLVCYHMDLKPDNILIFFERGRYVWKLSDFGMARIKIRHRTGQHHEEEKDFNSWFERRLRPNREPSTDGTINRRGEGTYLAPESMSTNPNMNTSSDVWSLGCVLSVFLTYLDSGHEGIVTYQKTRMKHSQANGFDRFFIATSSFRANQVHPDVDKWHHRLSKAAKARSFQEGQAVDYVLKQLEAAIFKVDPRDRRSARDVVAILRTTYRLLTCSEEELGPQNRRSGSTLRAPWKAVADKFRSKSNTDAILSRRVQGWLQANVENYKGCAISPDGALIVYWTDRKISVFTSQSLTPAMAHSVTPAAEYTLESQQYIWGSVCLAENWLIASTSGANFQCYIFDLEGGQSVDVSLDHWIRISLPDVPEIQRVIITPDAQKLVCSLRHWTDDRGPGAIFHARIAELRRYYRGPITPLPSEPASPPWRTINLEWPAIDITELVPCANDDLYMIVQPELTYRTQEHRVSVVCLSLLTENYEQLNIESQGLDTSTTVALFTTFTVFHKASRAVAVVSREKRLLIQQLTNNAPSPRVGSSDLNASDGRPPALTRTLTALTTATSVGRQAAPQVYEMQREVSRYRILRLILSRDDRRFYCIGTTVASHKLLLFTIEVPTTAGDELVVRELAQLGDLGYDDEFTAQLAERTSAPTTRHQDVSDEDNHDDDNDNDDDDDDDDSGTYLLVAALVGRGRRAIYRVPIENNSRQNVTSQRRQGMRTGSGRRAHAARVGGGAGLGLIT
ncbi:eukaryotic-like serine/threonine-protein kinase [Microdochium nivale]|nr:eukaryotic-like serine/threonine-protein kinase [Microdochium nivale]